MYGISVTLFLMSDLVHHPTILRYDVIIIFVVYEYTQNIGERLRMLIIQIIQ